MAWQKGGWVGGGGGAQQIKRASKPGTHWPKYITQSRIVQLRALRGRRLGCCSRAKQGDKD